MPEELAHTVAPGAVRLERRLPGPIERVWAYLTESDLRATWLASGPLEGRVGGAVMLRFRHADLSEAAEEVPERYARMAEAGHEMHGTVTAWQPPHLLRYTWDDEDEGSEVTFELRADGADVVLVLTHRRLDGRATMISVAAGWHTHVAILDDVLEGRRPPAFWGAHERHERRYAETLANEPDRLAPDGAGHLAAAGDGRALLRFVRHYDAPPETLWRALTEPDDLDRWYPARLRMEGRVGGWVRETFDGHDAPLPEGTLLALEPPHRLSFELQGDPDSTRPGWGLHHPQRLSFTVRERPGGCGLTFDHAFGDRRLAPDFAAGWHACLAALRSVVEGGREAPAGSDAPQPSPEAYRSWFGPEA